MSMTTRHLDLGCGSSPRNPYSRDELHGVDIQALTTKAGCEIRQANLALQPIPYPDSHFDSVSAYDFFEHVPRVLPTADFTATRFPFIELMDEIWRVLSPNGLLYAYTPAYPHAMAFQDPTHVNIITRNTHEYFTEPQLTGRMYGFKGRFAVVRVVPALSAEHAYEPTEPPGWYQRYRLRRRERRRENSHLAWELKALK